MSLVDVRIDLKEELIQQEEILKMAKWNKGALVNDPMKKNKRGGRDRIDSNLSAERSNRGKLPKDKEEEEQRRL